MGYNRMKDEQQEALIKKAYEEDASENNMSHDEYIANKAQTEQDPSLDFDDDYYDPTGDPLRYRLNPCTISRFKVLEPIGDAVAKLAVECPCCNGFRMIFAAIIGLVIGVLI